MKFFFSCSMTSYRYLAVSDDNLLDRNQNITGQPDGIKITRVYGSDEEHGEERSSGLRGRSQSLKHLKERVETGSISRSKSLRDVDTGDFDRAKAQVSYVDSWNPVNPAGRGTLATKIQSWENLDADEDTMSRSAEHGFGQRRISSSNSARKRSYDSYTRRASASERRRDEGYDASDGYDRDPDMQVSR